MKAFIIHGVDGSPEENWFPWLKKELEKLGIKTTVPHFPNSDKPELKEWQDFFKKYENDIDEETVLISHSLGSAFVLNYLENSNKKIKAAFLVASVFEIMDNEYDHLMLSFTEKEKDWEKIKNNCEKFFIFNSDDDPYIKLEKGKKLAKLLDSDLILVKDAKHFNSAAGYTEFELLKEKIKELC